MRTRDYVIRRPRPAAIVARDCSFCTRGWETFANEAKPVGARVARSIRDGSWDFTELSVTVGEALAAGRQLAGEIDPTVDPAQKVTVFRFRGGQPCFRHPGPARFFAGGREHVRLADWGEDLIEHLGNLNDQLRKG